MRKRHTYIAVRGTAAEAWELAIRLGQVLVQAGIAERYGVQARTVPGKRSDVAVGVYLVDRYPGEPYPSSLVFTAPSGATRKLPAALMALAA
ncbi:hypothetical protein [Kitasatospora sp. NPDC088779]|uniref:hypothetical protein n=1 Tax=Kitasatospora sp. NPDC088779 TaxID=3154964 RepID=UPI00343CC1EA